MSEDEHPPMAPYLMKGESFSIRPVRRMDEVRSITEVIRKAWDLTDLENIATFEMKAVADFGVVLMASPNENPFQAIGFIYAFPMFPDRNYSHMMGIDPAWQGKNVGFELKMVHRDLALQHTNPQINEILWTVDPLLPNNAWLNFGKLGVICKTYKINYYGFPEGVGIYSGVPTDRFLVQWQIRSNWVENKIKNVREGITRNFPMYEQFVDDEAVLGLIENSKPVKKSSLAEIMKKTETTVVEVPVNYQHIRETDTQLARMWRLFFREICTTLFSAGWIASDYIRARDEKGTFHNSYKFSKEATFSKKVEE